MPVPLTYPGVYIEEIPSGVRTIVGVSTSVTAFVGYTSKGPVNQAVKIFDFGAFEREFGGLDRNSEIGYAVQQFFLNGGSEAWIVRVASGFESASVILKNGALPNSKKVLAVSARSPGYWGNYLRLDVDYDTRNPDSFFNLIVSEYKPRGTELVLGRVETHSNLSMDQKSSRYAINVINAESNLIKVKRHEEVDNAVLKSLKRGWSLSGDLSDIKPNLSAKLSDTTRFISIIVDGKGPYEMPLFQKGATPPDILSKLANAIKEAVKNINPTSAPFKEFDVNVTDAIGNPDINGNFLLLTSGTPDEPEREQSSVRVLNASDNSATQTLKLGLSNGGREKEASADLRPSQTGTLSGDLADVDLSQLAIPNTMTIKVVDEKSQSIIGPGKQITLDSKVASLADLAKYLEKKIRSIQPENPVLSNMTVRPVGKCLRFVYYEGAESATITLEDDGGTLATKLKLTYDGTSINVQRYVLGTGIDQKSQVKDKSGNDGSPPSVNELIGNLGSKKGIYALEDVDIFNLLCIPSIATMKEPDALSVLSRALNYCKKKRAFMIIDPPKIEQYNSFEGIQEWVKDKLTADNFGAIYFPFVVAADPLNEFRLAPFPPSGTIAGLYARVDSNRGVWKAPAGTEATLVNVQGLSYSLTDMENGELNQLGINCLRHFAGYGRVCWGARTLEGADRLTSEWKYVPVRRLALYIEESLFRGTQWVVFEPNDEPLWAQIRLNLGAFMHDLFRKGAFQGQTSREAYFVKCDKETTPQPDRDKGIVNILVGFAPLKPAEFVIIKIQQIAGQIQT